MVARIDETQCTGCGKCLEGCPVDAIRMAGGKASIDEKECVACGACVPECPVEAISLG